MNFVRLDIPLLPPSPNATRRDTHWTARARVDRLWRSEGRLGGLTAIGKGKPPRWQKVMLSITFFLPDKRRRDPSNLVGSEGVKGLIDGLVDAGIIVDDNTNVIVEYGPFQFTYRKGQPGTRITVVPVE